MEHPLQQLLELFDEPALALARDGKVVAGNAALGRLLGDLSGGVAVEGFVVGHPCGEVSLRWGGDRVVSLPYRAAPLSAGGWCLRFDGGAPVVAHLAQELEQALRGRAQAEEAHRRFLTVLDGLDAIIYVADMESHELLFVNAYLRNLFGQEVVGRTCWQTLQTGQSRACDFCTNERLLTASGEPVGVIVWDFQNTSNGRWYECHDQAIPWPDGRLVRIEIAVDITARRRAEAALREAEALYRTLFEQSPDAVLVVDPKTTRPIRFNARMTELLGYTQEEFARLPVTAYEANEAPKEVARHIRAVVESGRDAFETVLRRKDGSTVEVQVSVRVLTLDGKPYLQSIVHDISPRKRAQAELTRLLAENRRLTRRQFLIQEEERAAIARDLHDELGQLLVAVRTQARLIVDACDAPRAGRVAQKVKVKAQGIAELLDETDRTVRRLLDRLRPTLVDELGLEKALRDLVTTWMSRHPDIEARLTLGTLPAGLDPELSYTVFRMVQEGLTNVVKHARARRVEVVVRRVRRGAELPLETSAPYLLSIALRDDGRGPDADATEGGGLPGMRERILALGGHFSVGFDAGKGVRLEALIPIIGVNTGKRRAAILSSGEGPRRRGRGSTRG